MPPNPVGLIGSDQQWCRSAVPNHQGSQDRLAGGPTPWWLATTEPPGSLKAPPTGGPTGPALTAPPTRRRFRGIAPAASTRPPTDALTRHPAQAADFDSVEGP